MRPDSCASFGVGSLCDEKRLFRIADGPAKIPPRVRPRAFIAKGNPRGATLRDIRFFDRDWRSAMMSRSFHWCKSSGFGVVSGKNAGLNKCEEVVVDSILELVGRPIPSDVERSDEPRLPTFWPGEGVMTALRMARRSGAGSDCGEFVMIGSWS